MEIVDVRIESCLNHWWITNNINEMSMKEKLEAIGCLELQLMQGLIMPRIIDRYHELCNNVGLKPRIRVKGERNGRSKHGDGNGNSEKKKFTEKWKS